MSSHEFQTQILDESQRGDVLDTIVRFLASKGVESVRTEFGFLIERDLRGEKQGEDAVVPLAEFRQFIERGLKEGTIEWSGTSDFWFFPEGIEMKLLLCNDSDLHFSSRNFTLLIELSQLLASLGVRAYERGKPVSAE